MVFASKLISASSPLLILLGLLSTTSFATALQSLKEVRGDANGDGVSKPFNLITAVTQGNSSLSGFLISGVHDGAGMQAAFAFVPSADMHDSSPGGFILNNTYVDANFNSGSNLLIYSLGLTGIGLTLIADVSNANIPININGIAGQQTAGWDISNGSLVYKGTDLPFQTFTVCQGISLYVVKPGLQGAQLFWRNTSSVADLKHCADVVLNVVYPGGS